MREGAKSGECNRLQSRMNMSGRIDSAAYYTYGIREMPKVISNFEKLTDSEKISVPDSYYQND